MKRLIPLAAALCLAGVAACSDREDDVVQQPAPNAAPEPVSETRADAATASAAVAFGMTREQMEDADLLSAQNTDLGDVETLVLDPQGRLTHVVIDLEGPGDLEVLVPVGDLSSVDRNGERDLTTQLTLAQLQALPAWTPGTAPAAPAR
ncbi:hypothetical protein [Brevundimonas sp.]|jgi:hypothetical protein|uniref:hypothetical protein n=1 Tax=Brevundimonas sp. TaxID=1871086 RepID=UPI0035B29945